MPEGKAVRENLMNSAAVILGRPVSELGYTTELNREQYGRLMKAVGIAAVKGAHFKAIFLGEIIEQLEAMEDAILPMAQRKNPSHG